MGFTVCESVNGTSRRGLGAGVAPCVENLPRGSGHQAAVRVTPRLWCRDRMGRRAGPRPNPECRCGDMQGSGHILEAYGREAGAEHTGRDRPSTEPQGDYHVGSRPVTNQQPPPSVGVPGRPVSSPSGHDPSGASDWPALAEFRGTLHPLQPGRPLVWRRSSMSRLTARFAGSVAPML
jgi:hypothetical protein